MMASLSDQPTCPASASSKVQHSACESAAASLLSFCSVMPHTVHAYDASQFSKGFVRTPSRWC